MIWSRSGVVLIVNELRKNLKLLKKYSEFQV